MNNPSELRLVRGVTAKIYQKLLPNITALPEKTPININHASEVVLMSLGNGLNLSQVDDIIKARGKSGIQDLGKIAELLQKLNIPLTQITVESTYYLSRAVTTAGDQSLTTYTLIKRIVDRKGIISVGIISQSLNTM